MILRFRQAFADREEGGLLGLLHGKAFEMEGYPLGVL